MTESGCFLPAADATSAVADDQSLEDDIALFADRLESNGSHSPQVDHPLRILGLDDDKEMPGVHAGVPKVPASTLSSLPATGAVAKDLPYMMVDGYMMVDVISVCTPGQTYTCFCLRIAYKTQIMTDGGTQSPLSTASFVAVAVDPSCFRLLEDASGGSFTTYPRIHCTPAGAAGLLSAGTKLCRTGLQSREDRPQ